MQHNVPHSHSTTNDAANLGSEKSRSSESYSDKHKESLSVTASPRDGTQEHLLRVSRCLPGSASAVSLCKFTKRLLKKSDSDTTNPQQKRIQKVRPCLCHCGRPQHARFTKHCDGFVVRYALVYLTIFQFPVAGAS